jgi:hypothetical protein
MGAVDRALGPVDEALGKVISTSWKYLNPMGQVVTLVDKFKDSSDEASDATRKYQEEISRQSDATAIQAAQAAHLLSVTEDATDATKKSAEAIEKETAAREESIESLMEAADSSLAFRNQQADTTAAIQHANSTMARTVAGSAEYEQAARDAEAAVMAQADAAVKLAEDQATANGAVFTAEDRAVTYQAELERLAAQLSGPARAAIQGYIDELNRIPRRVDTQVALNMPRRGPAAGGTSVVITGTGFGAVSGVKFGSTNATNYTVDSATQITATAPAGTGTQASGRGAARGRPAPLDRRRTAPAAPGLKGCAAHSARNISWCGMPASSKTSPRRCQPSRS